MFLNFKHFSLSNLHFSIGNQEWDSQNSNRIASREASEQTASSETVRSGSALFVLVDLAGNKCLK